MAAATATPLLDALGLTPGAAFLERVRELVDEGTLSALDLTAGPELHNTLRALVCQGKQTDCSTGRVFKFDIYFPRCYEKMFSEHY